MNTNALSCMYPAQESALLASRDVILGVSNKTANILRFDPEEFLSCIAGMDEENFIEYLKGEKKSEIQDKIFKTYHFLLQAWSKKYKKDWLLYEEGVKHFLGNFTQRIVYFPTENDSSYRTVNRILRLYEALLRHKNTKNIFKRTQKQYTNKDYETEPWISACEVDLGLIK